MRCLQKGLGVCLAARPSLTLAVSGGIGELAGNSPVVFPMKVNECVAISVHDITTDEPMIRVGICTRKLDRTKGGSKHGERATRAEKSGKCSTRKGGRRRAFLIF